ncbi:TPA: methyltransferase domain-containing protein [Vibrio cholerae]|nr:methyltransferase domain-containing protein [Vibrio cholerae]
MERMDKELIKKKFLLDEHYARYKFFSDNVKGFVVDCACGIGYASEIVLNNTRAKYYLGIDVSNESVKIATTTYGKDNAHFKVGSLDCLDLQDSCVDTFYCMETLEHIEEYKLDNCFKEIKRVLKSNGIFIGSVPSEKYDEKCSNVYGDNEYHITRFSKAKIKQYLNKYFEYVKIGVMTRQVCSVFIYDDSSNDLLSRELFDSNNNDEFGSFLFICSDEELDVTINDKLFMSQTLVEYDEEQLMPVFQAMRNAEKMALERYDLLRRTEGLCDERLDNIKHLEKENSILELERNKLILESKELKLEIDSIRFENEQLILENQNLQTLGFFKLLRKSLNKLLGSK